MPEWIAEVWRWATESPIGSGLTASAIFAIIVFAIPRTRGWIVPFFRFLQTLRLTTTKQIESTMTAAVEAERERVKLVEQEAVAGARRMARILGPDPWTAFKEPEKAWLVSRDGLEENHYSLLNQNEPVATEVSLKLPYGDERYFKFRGDPEWDSVETGEPVYFEGRVTDGSYFADLGISFEVHWTDWHGDRRVYRVKMKP